MEMKYGDNCTFCNGKKSDHFIRVSNKTQNRLLVGPANSSVDNIYLLVNWSQMQSTFQECQWVGFTHSNNTQALHSLQYH